MFENYRVFETTLAGRPLVVETGKLAQLASGACLVRYGETVLLCTVTASDKPREGVDFFPLSVDYEEKMYSVGKIPGSFQRRESRPSEKAILPSRVIDRPIRLHRHVGGSRLRAGNHRHDRHLYRHFHFRHPVGRPDFRRRRRLGGRRICYQPHP